HAVRGVHRGSKYIPVLEHHRTEVAADADRNRLLVDFELRMRNDLPLHLRGGIQRIVGGGEGRHDLIAHGFDDGTVVLLGGDAHDVDADSNHVACAYISQQLVQLGAADD